MCPIASNNVDGGDRPRSQAHAFHAVDRQATHVIFVKLFRAFVTTWRNLATKCTGQGTQMFNLPLFTLLYTWELRSQSSGACADYSSLDLAAYLDADEVREVPAAPPEHIAFPLAPRPGPRPPGVHAWGKGGGGMEAGCTAVNRQGELAFALCR